MRVSWLPPGRATIHFWYPSHCRSLYQRTTSGVIVTTDEIKHVDTRCWTGARDVQPPSGIVRINIVEAAVAANFGRLEQPIRTFGGSLLRQADERYHRDPNGEYQAKSSHMISPRGGSRKLRP